MSEHSTEEGEEERRQQERRYDDRRSKDLALSDHDLLVELRADFRHLETSVSELVTRIEFTPVKLIAYGLVGTLVSGVIAALLTVLFRVKMGG